MRSLAIICAFLLIGAHATFLEEIHKQKLRAIRDICVLESGLNHFEIANIVRAIRPTDKLMNASKCFARRIYSLRDEDLVLKDLMSRAIQSFSNIKHADISSHIINGCINFAGAATCEKALTIASLIIEDIHRTRESQASGGIIESTPTG